MNILTFLFAGYGLIVAIFAIFAFFWRAVENLEREESRSRDLEGWIELRDLEIDSLQRELGEARETIAALRGQGPYR